MRGCAETPLGLEAVGLAPFDREVSGTVRDLRSFCGVERPAWARMAGMGSVSARRWIW